MKKVKAVFLDNDGVLVDTECLYFEANRVVYSRFGIELTEECYIENFLKNSKGAWHLFKEKGFTEERISQLREGRNRIYLKLLEEKAGAIDGAENVLKQLYGKKIIGVVTSSRKDHFEIIHKKTGFNKYFDFVLTSDDYEHTKPNPEPYIKAIEKSGMNKEECIAVEDSERGLRAALAAGIRCYVIPTHLTKNSDFTGAEKVLKNIDEIIPIIFDLSIS